MQDAAAKQDPAVTPVDVTDPGKPRAVAAAAPRRIYVERVGWRIMLEEPGELRKQVGADVDKGSAVQQGRDIGQAHANTVGETVELHITDAQGRPSAVVYFNPVPTATDKKGGK